MNEYPWIGVDRWRNGEIKTNLALPFYVLLGLSTLLIAISAPIMVTEWATLSRHVREWLITDPSTFNPKLLLFGLPLAWLFTLKPLYRYWRRWRRFRSVALTLDPYPGSVGGQVGGYVSVPVRWDANKPVDVRLNCVRVSVSGSGKNRSRSERVHWRKRATARATPAGANSTHIEFLVDVDDDLPSSDAKRRNAYTYWAVHIRLDGSDFDQSFEIPVFDTGRPQPSKLRLAGSARSSHQKKVGDIQKTVAEVRDTGAGFAIDLPAGRSGAMGIVLAVIGLVLAAIAAFMWYRAYTELASENTQYFALLVSSMIASGFSLFALPLILGGIFVHTNRLSVILDRNQLTVERKAFGRRFRKLISTDDIHDLVKQVTAQSGQGANARLYYAIKLETRGGRKMRIADGIPGQEDADALLDFVRSKITLQPAEVERPQGKLPRPAWAGYAVAATKVVSALLVLATAAAFLADFTR